MDAAIAFLKIAARCRLALGQETIHDRIYGYTLPPGVAYPEAIPDIDPLKPPFS